MISIKSIVFNANIIRFKINLRIYLIHKSLPSEDSNRRKPNISLVKEKLGWQPQRNFTDGCD